MSLVVRKGHPYAVPPEGCAPLSPKEMRIVGLSPRNKNGCYRACRKEGCFIPAADRNRGYCPFHKKFFVPREGSAGSLCLGQEFMERPGSRLCDCGLATCFRIGYPNKGLFKFPTKEQHVKEWLEALEFTPEEGRVLLDQHCDNSAPCIAYWHFLPQHLEYEDGQWKLLRLPGFILKSKVWTCGTPPLADLEDFVLARQSVNNEKSGSILASTRPAPLPAPPASPPKSLSPPRSPSPPPLPTAPSSQSSIASTTTALVKVSSSDTTNSMITNGKKGTLSTITQTGRTALPRRPSLESAWRLPWKGITYVRTCTATTKQQIPSTPTTTSSALNETENSSTADHDVELAFAQTATPFNHNSDNTDHPDQALFLHQAIDTVRGMVNPHLLQIPRYTGFCVAIAVIACTVVFAIVLTTFHHKWQCDTRLSIVDGPWQDEYFSETFQRSKYLCAAYAYTGPGERGESHYQSPCLFSGQSCAFLAESPCDDLHKDYLCDESTPLCRDFPTVSILVKECSSFSVALGTSLAYATYVQLFVFLIGFSLHSCFGARTGGKYSR